MPLSLIIATFLGLKDQAKDPAAYCVGTVGNARVRAVPHYGTTGFEVSWQVVPANASGDAAHGDRFPLDQAALERATRA